MTALSFRKLPAFGPALSMVVLVAGLVAAGGFGAAFYMEEHGHIVTGMNNQIVWGMPHVFAVFLIVAASGALNMASVSSVFGNATYKPLARVSGLMALALLAGGLMVLVLDLGRPERLIIAMTHYNFKSIFAWNVFLYTGFMVIVAAYLFVMMDRIASKNAKLGKALGWTAFIWRLILTTGTGSIFGFLVARAAYDTALLAPLFIASSLLYGTAFTVLLLALLPQQEELLDAGMMKRLQFLMIIFALSVIYFTGTYHLTKLYGTKYHGFEAFILRSGDVYPAIFWFGQIAIGLLAPMALIVAEARKSVPDRRTLVLASLFFLFGGLAQMYVIIVGGQAYPIEIFAGAETSSVFSDGAMARYTPSLWEVLLGSGGVAVAVLIVAFALKLLPFLPRTVEVSASG